MLKKMIAALTVCAMLAPLSPAVAADEPTVTPTIEEILNEYHQKAFEAQTQEETGAASTYSRQAAGSARPWNRKPLIPSQQQAMKHIMSQQTIIAAWRPN